MIAQARVPTAGSFIVIPAEFWLSVGAILVVDLGLAAVVLVAFEVAAPAGRPRFLTVQRSDAAKTGLVLWQQDRKVAWLGSKPE